MSIHLYNMAHPAYILTFIFHFNLSIPCEYSSLHINAFQEACLLLTKIELFNKPLF